MADIELVIKIDEEDYKIMKHNIAVNNPLCPLSQEEMVSKVAKGIPLTPDMLADLLIEERIRGKLNSDTTFEKDVISDVKCRLTVSIRDRRPCYCGAELKEVWRESEEN